MLDRQQKLALVVEAALTEHSTGDCKALYNRFVLANRKMTKSQMKAFLELHSSDIDECRLTLVDTLVERADETVDWED